MADSPDFVALLERLEMEANYGLNHAHQGKMGNRHCNACRALEVIVTIVRQVRGIPVKNPINLGHADPYAATEGETRG